MEEINKGFSRAAIALMRGIVGKEQQGELYANIVEQQSPLADYLAKIGLCLVIDEVEEYAYLKQVDAEGIPRLVPRHSLSYPVSLLLVLLRKSLGEYDAANGDRRLLLTRDEIVEKMRTFFQATTNEIRFMQKIDVYIGVVENMGFLRKLKAQTDTYEVVNVLRSFVNAEWLRQFDERLQDYIDYGLVEDGAAEQGEGIDGLV
jgi:hypothetical protein